MEVLHQAPRRFAWLRGDPPIGHSVVVVLNPPSQYADDRNLRARQRLWQHQTPFFDIAGWVLSLGRRMARAASVTTRWPMSPAASYARTRVGQSRPVGT